MKTRRRLSTVMAFVSRAAPCLFRKKILSGALCTMLAAAFLQASPAYAGDWMDIGFVSGTLGNSSNRLCQGAPSWKRASDFGCPAHAPYLTSGGLLGIGTTTPNAAVDVYGTVSATNFVGDGSGLTGVIAGATDRIVSGSTGGTRMVAISATGYISITQAGANSGWFNPYTGLVTLGVSSSGGISGSSGYFSRPVGIGTSAPSSTLYVAGGTGMSGGIKIGDTSGNDRLSIYHFGSLSAVLQLNKFGGLFIADNAGGRFAGFQANGKGLTVGSNFVDYGPPANGLVVEGRTGIGTGSPTATLQVSGSFIVSTSVQTTTPSLYVGNDGFVGIGTNAPKSQLHIKGEAAGILLEETYAGADNEALLVNYNNQFAIHRRRDDGTLLSIPYAFDMRAPSYLLQGTASGTITIGATTGGSSLTIVGEAQVGNSGAACVSANNAGAIRYSAGTLYYCNASNTWTALGTGTGTVGGTGSATAIAFWNGPNTLTYENALTSGLYWNTSNKRLGLGTNVPGGTLHVSGTEDAIIVDTSTMISNTRAAMLFKPNGSQWEFGARGATSNAPNALYAYDRSATAFRFVISQEGRMGVGGIIAPATTLDVSGTLRAKADVDTLVMLDTPATGQQAAMSFYSNGATKWQLGKGTADQFFLWDPVGVRTALNVYPNGSMGLMPSGGDVGIGTLTPGASFDVSATRMRLSQIGGTNNSPYMEWYKDGTRQAYMGWGAPGSFFTITMENNNQLIVSALNAAFSGNVGIGTGGSPINSSLTVAHGEIQTSSSGKACASAQNGGAIRYSAGTLYYCNASNTWTALGTGTGTVGGTGSATAIAFWNGPDSLTYESASTSGLYWDVNNKRLGVGKNAPVSNLDVSGSIRASVYALTPDVYTNRVVDFFTGHNAQIAFGGASKSIAFSTSATEAMRITSAGNVGIGISSPLAKLDVNGTISATDAIQVGNSSLTCGVPIAGALRYNSGSIQYCNGAAWFSLGVGSGTIDGTGTANYGAIFSDVSTLVTDSALYVDRVSHRLGVGTTSPGARLSVSGVSQTVRFYTAGGTSSGTSSMAVAIGSPKNTVSVFIGSGNDESSLQESTSGYGVDESSGNLRFNGTGVNWGDFGYYPKGGGNGNYGQYRFSVAGSEIVRTPNAKVGVGSLYSAGAIGIGTVSPASSLTIVGEAQVGNSGAACVSANNAGAIRYTGGSLYYCNGSNAWVSLSTSAGGTPAGSTGDIQFNTAGAFDADTGRLYWDKANDRLGIGTGVPSSTVHILNPVAGGGISILTIGNPAVTGNNVNDAVIALYGENNGVTYLGTIAQQSNNMFLNPNGKAGNVIFLGNAQTAAGKKFIADDASDTKQFELFHDGTNAVMSVSSGNFSMTGGNVGIGTDAPSNMLTVSTTTTPMALFVTNGDGVNPVIQLKDNSPAQGRVGSINFLNGGGYSMGQLAYATSQNYMRITTNAVERMRIVSTGHVGISTSTPKAMLDVVGTISASDAIQVGNSSLTCGVPIAGALRYNSGSIQYCNGAAWSTLSAGGGTVGGTGSATAVAFWDGPSSLTYDGALYWNNINKGLGIGVTNPTGSLDISQTNLSANTINIANANGTEIAFNGASAHANIVNFGNDSKLFINSTNGAIHFGNGGVGSTDMILRGGKLGVGGVSVPSANLEVSGSFIVSSTATPNSPSIYVGTNGGVSIGSTTNAWRNSGSGLYVARYTNRWGLMIAGDGNTQADILLKSNYNQPDQQVVQLVNGSNAFDIRVVTDAGLIGKSLLSANLTTSAVGISNTAPRAKLDVIGTISASDAIQVGDSSLTCGAPIAGALRYNGGSIQYCNGVAWSSLGAGGGTVGGTGSATAIALWNGPNSLTYESATTSGLYWDVNNKRLGVGKNGPANTVDVSGSIRASQYAITPDIYTNRLMDLNSGVYAQIVFGGVNKSIAFITSNSEAMRITSEGKVGVGTSNPSATLHVIAPVNSRAFYMDVSGLGASGGLGVFGGGPQLTGIGWRNNLFGNNLYLPSSNIPTVDGATSGYTKAYAISFASEDTTDTGMTFWTGSGAGTAMTAKMRLTNAGSVGIGTVTPGSSLTIVGEAQVGNSGAACVSAKNAGAIRYNAGSLSYCNGSNAWVALSTSAGTPVGSTGDIQFNTAGAFDADTGKLYWDKTNDRLGVGTSSPGATLTISSTADTQLSMQNAYGKLIVIPGYSANNLTYIEAGNGTWTGNNAGMVISGYNSANMPVLMLNANSVQVNGTMTATGMSFTQGTTLAASTDLNTVIANGHYRLSGTPVNSPGSGALDYGQMIVSRGLDTILQIAAGYQTNANYYFRSGNPTNVGGTGVYSAWRKMLYDGMVDNVSIAGNLTATAFLYSSDKRLKSDITELSGGLAKLDALNPVSFRFTADPSKTIHLGLIAQDVQKVYPEAVKEDDKGFLKLNYPSLIGPIIGMLKELKADNDNLKAANDNLKVANEILFKRVNAIEQRLNDLRK